MPSPSARSMKALRDEGYIVAKVEQRLPIPGKFVTKDCYGFGDLLAARRDDVIPFQGVIALVQVTSGSNHNARREKIMAEPLAELWKSAGGKIFLHSWAKRGPRGKRKTWTLKAEQL
jgi:hypothetical protein